MRYIIGKLMEVSDARGVNAVGGLLSCRKYFLWAAIFLAIPALLFTGARCVDGAASKGSKMGNPYERKFLLGVGFWPTDYSPAYVDANFKELLESAEIAYVQPEWTTESNSALNRIFDSWLERSRKAGLRTYIAIECLTGDRQGIRNPQGRPDITFADHAFRRAYRDQVVRMARKHRPDYLNIGVEINMYLKTHPDDTENFISLYREIYSEVKKVSPRTKVFVSFQYEVLKGEFLGTVGEPQWGLLGKFQSVQDLIGISSYPRFANPPYDTSKIPMDYYYALKKYSSRPIFFAEIGWYSSASVNPPSSERGQADFIRRLVGLLEPLSVEAVNWVGLRDPRDIPALAELKKQLPQFFSLGLKRSNGEIKSAWSVWKNLKDKKGLGPEESRASLPPVKKPQPIKGKELLHFSFDSSTENFHGIGASKDLRVTRDTGKIRAGKGALQWKYAISTNPLPMLLRDGIDMKGGTSISFWLKSRNPTQIALILVERSGARFEYRLDIKTTDWLKYEISLSDFSNPKGSGSLNTGKINRFAFIDIYGFAGGKGENTVFLDELKIN